VGLWVRRVRWEWIVLRCWSRCGGVGHFAFLWRFGGMVDRFELVTIITIKAINMKWVELLQNLGIFGIITTAISYLFNNIINKKFEAYKKDLESDLESHKSELSLFNARDSKVFTKRITVIEELYHKLVILDSSMKILTARIHDVYDDVKKEQVGRAQNAHTAIYEFSNFFYLNKLYFSKSTCENIEKIATVYKEANWKYHEKDRLALMGANLAFEEIKKNYDQAYVKVNSECELIKRELEKEFRGIYQIEN